MTAVTVLAGAAIVLLLPLVVTAVRQRTALSMATRNIGRRRSEAALVVGGALLGTAIITSSFVVGDVIEATSSDLARTGYGPIDVTVTAPDDVPIAEVAAAVEVATISGSADVLATSTSRVTLEAVARGAVAPRVDVLELDLDVARGFGADPDLTGIADTVALRPGEILVNDRTAGQLGAAVGDRVRLHVGGDAFDLDLVEVVAEVGFAGYGGAIVAPGTLVGGPDRAGPSAARDQLLVTFGGDVADTRERSDLAVAELRAAVADLPGVEVDAPKAAVLDDAARAGAGYTELFSIIGSFSVLAGILLLINLFVMLAEERRTELGVLRAIGFTRRRLAQATALEGAVYAVVAAVAGAVAGVGIGWLVAMVARRLFGGAELAAGFPLVIEPRSLAVGGLTGLVIAMTTIWVASLRIARVNVVRAMRDLPEPSRPAAAPRTLVLAGVGVVLGAALGVAGYLASDPIALLVGLPLAAFAAGPWLRRSLADRPVRVLVAGTTVTWALAVWALFPTIMSVDGNPALFVAQGVVLTAGAVSLTAWLDEVWAAAFARLGRRGGRLAPRLGFAYLQARGSRTAALRGMFALVTFTVTILASVSATFTGGTDVTAAEAGAGFDVVLDTDPTTPLDLASLRGRDEVTAIAGIVRGDVRFEAEHLDGTGPGTISGFDADLVEHGTPPLLDRDLRYRSDADTFAAVLDDPSLTIVPDGFLAGVGGSEVRVGDTLTVVDPVGAGAHHLTVVGVGEMDWLGNGALVHRDLASSVIGSAGEVARTYLGLAAGVDADVFADALDRDLRSHGAEAHSIRAMVADAIGEQTALLAMLQGFLGLGLLIGTAGLGVVMVRAVRERRRDIGTLRAVGASPRLVRASLLHEAGLITVQGSAIGVVTGLLTTRQLLVELGDQLTFTVPWFALAVLVVGPLVATLAATAWPASRAAAIRPAVVLRAAD